MIKCRYMEKDFIQVKHRDKSIKILTCVNNKFSCIYLTEESTKELINKLEEEIKCIK